MPDKDHDVIQGPASGLTGNDRSALGEAASQLLHGSWWLHGICKNTRLARPRGEWGCVVENKKGPPLGEPFLIRHQESKNANNLIKNNRMVAFYFCATPIPTLKSFSLRNNDFRVICITRGRARLLWDCFAALIQPCIVACR